MRTAPAGTRSSPSPRPASSRPDASTGPLSRADGSEPLPRAGGRTGRLLLAVPRRRRRDELGEQPARRLGHGVDRALERLLVRLRRLREAADLADVLQRGVPDLFLGRGRIEVVQLADVATHLAAPLFQWDSGVRHDIHRIKVLLEEGDGEEEALENNG